MFYRLLQFSTKLGSIKASEIRTLNPCFPGEHIKTWRPRYFILKTNGQFNGFKKEPTTEADFSDPLNNFTGKEFRKKVFFMLRSLLLRTILISILAQEP